MAGIPKKVLNADSQRGRICIVIGRSGREPEQLRDCLGAEWEIALCTDLQSLRGDSEVVVCDADESGESWRAILRRVREVNRAAAFVLLSRLADERLWSELLHEGGYDVLPKPLDRLETLRVFRGAGQYVRAVR